MDTSNIRELIENHPFLKGLEPKYYDKLAALASKVRFHPDQLIFREGDESSFFYLILSGKVALEVPAPGKTFRIQTIGEGEELGWSSLLSPVKKQFQARCIAAADALAFDGARLLRECEADPKFGYELMRRVVGIVAERLQATRLQLLDVFKPVGAKML
jgi:CRP/FNR family cyclic AMP-dependent transcriptional regulator